MFAAEIKNKRVGARQGMPQWRWHLDEVFVKINGQLLYLWRAVDHEGEVLDVVVQSQSSLVFALVIDEEVRPPSCDRHRQAALVWRGYERDR